MVTAAQKQLVENILSQPDAPIILRKVEDQLAEERQKRERFYNEISEFEKAEFINGEIIIHSPVKKEHNGATTALHRVLSTYVLKHELGYVGYEKIMISLSRNDYEPNLCYFNQDKARKFKKGQSLFPAPDLVVEVLSKKTGKIDREIKFADYQAHGVLEYWMIDPVKEVIEQYRLDKKGMYELIIKAGDGTLHSKAVRGFTIDIEAIFDERRNLEALQRLLAK